MSNVPPPPPSNPNGGGGQQIPLPEPRPGWIPGSELPGTGGSYGGPSAPPPQGGPSQGAPYQPPYPGPYQNPYQDPYQNPYGTSSFGQQPPPKQRRTWLAPVAIGALVIGAGVTAYLVARDGDDDPRATPSTDVVDTLDATQPTADPPTSPTTGPTTAATTGPTTAATTGPTTAATTGPTAGPTSAQDLDTSAAASTLAVALTPFADLPSGTPTPLASCEGIDLRTVAMSAPPTFDAGAALTQPLRAALFRGGVGPVVMECYAPGTHTRFGVDVGAAPAVDFETYMSGVASMDYDAADEEAHAGGTLHPFCFQSPVGETCQTMWLNDELQVSLFAGGSGADREMTTAWLRDALAGIVDELAAMDPTGVEAAGGDVAAGLSTAAAAASIDAAFGQLAITSAGALLADCAATDLDEIAASAPLTYDPEPALAGRTQASLVRPGAATDPVLMQCLATNGVVGWSVGVGRAPGDDFESYIARLGTVDYDPADATPFSGGTMHPFCFDAGGVETCETLWMNADIQVALSAAGPGIDRQGTTEWLSEVLADIVADLEEMTPDDVVLV